MDVIGLRLMLFCSELASEIFSQNNAFFQILHLDVATWKGAELCSEIF